jgi:hypothetical protein
LDLAADPDQGGRVYGASLQEAHVMLTLEEAGELPGPLTRQAGRGDCTDASGQDWDVKAFRDYERHPPFNVHNIVEGYIRFEVRCGENVIMDLTGIRDPANRAALRQAVDGAGLAAHVRWYE